MFQVLSFILLTYFSPSTASIPKHIFLLAGQSNMSGRGGVINDTWDGIIPPQCRSRPAILRLNAALVWVEAAEPLHRDMDPTKTCGVGPGMAFANRVLDSDSDTRMLGLVPCAVGGTNISEWARGSFLYNQLVQRAEVAVKGGGTLRGLLWYQGESDTLTKNDAEIYKKRLQKFFLDLREDLVSPSLPIIQVALASGSGPYVEIVREAQIGMNIANVKCVDAKGLALEPDHLHLNTPSQVQLGQMLADAFLQYLPNPIMSNAPKTSHFFVLESFFRNLARLIRWIIDVNGAPGTLYANETYQLQVDFPEHYPMEAPQVIFVPPAPLHPCIYSNSHIFLGKLAHRLKKEGAKETEKINEEGAVETKVETVDYRKPAGQPEEEEPIKEKVTVVHLSRPEDDSGGGAGKVLTDAASAVGNKVKEAKEAISGTGDKK